MGFVQKTPLDAETSQGAPDSPSSRWGNIVGEFPNCFSLSSQSWLMLALKPKGGGTFAPIKHGLVMQILAILP